MPDGQPGATLKPVKTTDVYRTHAAAGGAEQKYPSPGCRSGLAGANSVVFYATGAIVGNAIAPARRCHAADHPVCAGDGGLHSAFRRAGANAGPQSGVQARHRRRDGDRTGGRPGGSAEFFSAVLSRRDARRRLCRRGAQFSFLPPPTASPRRAEARALSLVMGGGVAAGIIGPMLVTGTMHLWPAHIFAVTFLAQALVAVLAAFLLRGVTPAEPTAAQRARRAAAARDCPPAGFCHHGIQRRGGLYGDEFSDDRRAALHAHMHGLSQQAANLGIQWHVMAMYGPGFFTGRLIQRFGAVRMAAAGLLITAASVAVGLSGLGVYHYWLSLILLGIGWNFGFTGASAKIIDFHRPEEKTQVQSLNDFLVFGVMIVGSFSSGVLLNAFGWNAVLWGSLVPVAVALLTLLLRPLSPPRA